MIVIGVDSAKDRIDAVALLDGEYLDQMTVDFGRNPPSRAQSLNQMRNMFTSWVNSLIWTKTTHAEEVRIFVEESIVVRSPRVAIQLAHTVGMLLALPYLVYPVPIDSWKQIAAGKGGVKKDVVKAKLIEAYPWAREELGKRQDLFDALGVAVYGEAVLRREI